MVMRACCGTALYCSSSCCGASARTHTHSLLDDGQLLFNLRQAQANHYKARTAGICESLTVCESEQHPSLNMMLHLPPAATCTIMPGATVFAAELSPLTRECDLELLFERYGELKYVDIRHDEDNGLIMAHIHFEYAHEANVAIEELQGSMFHGQALQLMFAYPCPIAVVSGVTNSMNAIFPPVQLLFSFICSISEVSYACCACLHTPSPLYG